MGRIIELKNGTYAIKFELANSTREKRKQKQIGGFKNKTDAKKALRDVESKIENGLYFNTKITVNRFIEIWLQEHVINLKPKTQYYYHSLCDNYIKPYFDGIPLKDLKANTINKFYKHLSNAATIDIAFKCHKTLRACLNMAYKWDYTDKRIIDKVTAPTEPVPTRNFWDEDTIKKALIQLKDSPVFFHVYMSLHLGLRLGEACALTFDDVDPENNLITIDKTLQYIKLKNQTGQLIIDSPKTTHSIRKIPLTKNVKEFLLKEVNKIEENKKFFTKDYNKTYDNNFSVFENGDIKNDSYVTKRFKKDLKKTDLPIIKFHDLRHSCASWLIYKNIDIKTVQEILGHADFSTTANIYAHVTKDKKLEALNKLI